MKCAKHPTLSAVGVCVSCGIGVCKDCEIKVLGRTHCKTCVEAGRAHDQRATPARTYPEYTTPGRAHHVSTTPVRSPSVAKPSGPPTRAFFIIGFIGMIILIASAMINWIFDNTSIFLLWGYVMPNIVYTISLILFCSSIVLTSFALYGYRRNYGSLMSMASFIISLIFPWFLLVSKLLFYTGLVFIPHQHPYYSYWYYLPGPLYTLYIILYIIGSVLIGVMLILWGCALIVVRKYTGRAGLPIASGIIFIIAGSFWCTLYLYSIGSILLIPAGIIWMISLATSRIPDEFVY